MGKFKLIKKGREFVVTALDGAVTIRPAFSKEYIVEVDCGNGKCSLTCDGDAQTVAKAISGLIMASVFFGQPVSMEKGGEEA